MAIRVLHLIDSSTNADALEMLAGICGLPVEQHVASLGHRNGVARAVHAGVSRGRIVPLRSMGWLDPMGWRGLKQLIVKLRPSHLHAWSDTAIFAGNMAHFSGQRLATLAQAPTGYPLQALRGIANTRSSKQSPWTFIAASDGIREHLVEHGIRETRVRVIRPGGGGLPTLTPAQIKKELGIPASAYPVILHGGEGKNARQDFAIWTTGVLAQIFPNIRLVLREDPQTLSFPGLERFTNIPEENKIITAAASMAWPALLAAADIFLVTATGPIPTGSIRAAMRAGVPIVASPIACVKELLTHQRTALIARHTGVGIALPMGNKTIQPRAFAAQLEILLTTAGLAGELVAAAKLAAEREFPEAVLRRDYRELYEAGAGEGVVAEAATAVG